MAYRDIFDELEPNERIQVLQGAKECSWPPGATLIREGYANQTLFVILEGDITVVSDGQTVTQLGVGSIVGEMSFLSRESACATVVACNDVTALCIHHHTLRRFLENQPQLGLKLYHSIASTLAHRLRETTRAYSSACQ